MGGMTDWTIEKFLPMGPLGLFILAFAESSFFPVPPDVVLIALALIEPSTSFILALITTVGSVLGAAFGYIIGKKGGRPLLEKIVSAEKIALAHEYFNKYDVWAIGIAGFTPIPYKVFTISAGVFSVNFLRFTIASIISRGARFFLVGGAIYFFGETIKEYVQKYFNIFSIVFVAALIGGFIVIRIIAKKRFGGGKKA